MLGSIAALLGMEFRASLRQKLNAALVMGVAGILALAAAGYGLGALTLVLAERYGAINARLLMAGGLLLCAGIAAIVALIIQRRRSDHRAVTVAALVATAPLAGQLVKRMTPGLLTATPIIVIAGIIAGRMMSKE